MNKKHALELEVTGIQQGVDDTNTPELVKLLNLEQTEQKHALELTTAELKHFLNLNNLMKLQNNKRP